MAGSQKFPWEVKKPTLYIHTEKGEFPVSADVIPLPNSEPDFSEELELFLNHQPLPFTPDHCKPARLLLG